jgi:hypothetical protein
MATTTGSPHKRPSTFRWGQDVALRAAGSVAHRDAFQSDGTGNQREYAGRLQIYASPLHS